MRHVKKFDHLNENLKPGFSNEELAALMLPVINQVKAASFTKEAQESGDITNEQVLGLIVSKLTGWDYEKISATAGYAYEDSNYRDEAEKMFKEAGIQESVTEGEATGRKLSDIAKEIRADWKSVNYAAKPYLEAMMDCDTIDGSYGQDSCASVVGYFLSNASQWKGDKAKAIKKELNDMLKKYYK